MDELEAELRTIIAKELSIDESDVVPTADLRDDLGADSLMFLNLAEAIGARWKFALKPDDLADTTRVADLVELVRKRKAG